MKSIQQKITCLFLLLCLLGYGATLGNYDQAAKQWEVDTGVLKCTFFQGCMYPVWFKNQAGKAFPFFIFADTLKHDGKTAFLEEERWAEFRILENSDERFTIECKGNFCYGQQPYNIPDEAVSAVYTYRFVRGKSEIDVAIRLVKPTGTAYDVELCVLRWRYLPFASYGNMDLKKLPFMESCLFESALLHHATMDLRLGGHKVVLRREPYGNHLFYMKDAEGIRQWPAESTELNVRSCLSFTQTNN